MTGSKSYEIKVLVILFFSWGFVFMDRLSMSFLAPTVMLKLNMTNTDLGWLGFATSASYAVSSIIFGFVSDKLGLRKKILLPFLLATAVFSALGVMVNSFAQLLLIRAILGFCEGPIFPLICTMLFSINKNSFGRNVGIISAAVGVIGTTIGPVFITQLAAAYSWQMTFLVSSLPTFVMFVLVLIFVKEILVEKEAVKDVLVKKETVKDAGKVNEKAKFTDIFKYRNVVICLIMGVFGLAGYWTTMLYSSVYLVEVSHFNLQSMGWVTSAMGILYIIYCILIPKLTDNFGRKPILFIGLLLSVIPPLFMFLFPGVELSVYAYILLFGITPGVIPIFMMMMPMESVPLTLVATVGAFVQGTGDLLGSAIWPVIAGRVADAAGLPVMMLTASVFLLINAALTFLLKETRPRLRKQKSAVTVSQ